MQGLVSNPELFTIGIRAGEKIGIKYNMLRSSIDRHNIKSYFHIPAVVRRPSGHIALEVVPRSEF
jgi:hypothetical protein